MHMCVLVLHLMVAGFYGEFCQRENDAFLKWSHLTKGMSEEVKADLRDSA